MKTLLPVWTVIAALGVIVAGCASQAKKSEPPPKVAGETEWEYRYVTGSNIPIKVPKSPTAHPLPTATPLQIMSPEDFREVVHRGQH